MLSRMALSNGTVKGKINGTISRYKRSTSRLNKRVSFLCYTIDKIIDIESCFQLLLYACFLSVNTIKEEMLFCHPMKSHATSADIFNVVANFFQDNQPSWQSLAGACTDRAPAIIGLKSDFIQRVKERKPSVMGTHCILHREALASRILPREIKEVLDLSIEIVNYMKPGSLSSRLFKLLCQDMESEHVALLFHTNCPMVV